MQSINSLNTDFYGYTFKIIMPFKLLSCLQNPNCLNISFREIFMKPLNSECQIQHLGSKAYGWYLSPVNIHIHHFKKKYVSDRQNCNCKSGFKLIHPITFIVPLYIKS